MKRLAVERGKFLKKEQRLRSWKVQENCRLQVFIMK